MQTHQPVLGFFAYTLVGAGDFHAQRWQRATALGVLQVGQAQVLLQAALQAFAGGAAVGEADEGAVGQFAADHFGEQVVLGREVVVEGTACQADGLHQTGNAGGGKTAALGQCAAASQQPFAGLLLVFVGIAHPITPAHWLDDEGDHNIVFVY